MLSKNPLMSPSTNHFTSLYKVANQLCACYNEEDGDSLVMYMDYINWPSKVYKKEWFDAIIQQPFEGFWIPVSAYYDDILKIIYGDYQKRIRGALLHDYPMYNKQLNHIREVVGGVEKKYARIEELIAEAKKERMEDLGEK